MKNLIRLSLLGLIATIILSGCSLFSDNNPGTERTEPTITNEPVTEPDVLTSDLGTGTMLNLTTFFTEAEREAGCTAKFIGSNGDEKNELYEIRCGKQNDPDTHSYYNVAVFQDGKLYGTPIPHQEFYYYKEHFYKGSQQLTTTTVPELILKRKITDYEELREWHRRVEGDTMYIYFGGAAGCGGCAWTYAPYLKINLKTNAITTDTLKNKSRGNTDFVFQKSGENYGYIHNSRISPDGNTVAYVDVVVSDSEINQLPQTVYEFNFKTQTERKVMEIPANESVVTDGMGPWLPDDAFTWDANGKLQVKTRPRNADGSLPY